MRFKRCFGKKTKNKKLSDFFIIFPLCFDMKHVDSLQQQCALSIMNKADLWRKHQRRLAPASQWWTGVHLAASPPPDISPWQLNERKRRRRRRRRRRRDEDASWHLSRKQVACETGFSRSIAPPTLLLFVCPNSSLELWASLCFCFPCLR